MLDNLEVAVLSKVNELAGRHGIKPHEFVATFQSFDRGDGRHEYRLRYEAGDLDSKPFDRMLTALGVPPGEGELTGPANAIYDALESAIAKSPRVRPRS